MPQCYFEKVSTCCDAEIYFWHIEENCDRLSELIDDNGVSLAEAQKRFRSLDRQCEWLATRALLQQTPYKGTKILYHSNGRPYLVCNNKYISISHTRKYVAIAVSDTPVGIDMEDVERNALAIAKSFLQQQEIDSLSVESNPEKEALFLWCVKEAAFKLASEKAVVLKEIRVAKSYCGYNAVYPDDSVAKSYVQILDGLVLAVAYGLLIPQHLPGTYYRA